MNDEDISSMKPIIIFLIFFHTGKILIFPLSLFWFLGLYSNENTKWISFIVLIGGILLILSIFFDFWYIRRYIIKDKIRFDY
jgi:hypothetical protein